MKRYIRSRRTRKNVYESNALRDQFIRQLTLEAEALMKQLSEQFNQTLQTQVAQAFQGIVVGDNQAQGTAGAPQPNSIGSIGQLLSLGARYLVSRPRTSRSGAETSRSIANEVEFRTSRAQQLAEAQQAIGQGEKNL